MNTTSARVVGFGCVSRSARRGGWARLGDVGGQAVGVCRDGNAARRTEHLSQGHKESNMKRLGMVAVAVAMMGMSAPAMAQDATSKLMAAAAEKANVLMQVSFEYVQDASQPVPTQRFVAQAICISKEGLFMTFGIGMGMRSAEMNDLRLTAPGENGVSVKAEFLWTDRETNISFLRATEPGDFTPATFVTKGDLKIGARVATVGMFEADPARSPYVSVGYVASVIRMPGQFALVTGGSTTNEGSPVLNEAGEFIGVTPMSQFLPYQVRTNQGVQEMQLESKTMGHFFRPAGEFVHVLEYAKKNPTKPRVLSWIGVLDFRAVDESSVLKAEVPAVVVGRVAAEGPAAAVLKENDVIVAIDGKGLEKFSSPILIRNAFVLKLFRMTPGQAVKLTIRRDGKQSDVEVMATAQPQDDSQVPRFIVTQLGFRVRERAELDRYVMPEKMAKVPGLVVMQVWQQTSAERANLRPGDIVMSVNNVPVTKVAAFKSEVLSALSRNPGTAVTLVVQRDQDTLTLPLQPPATVP